MSDYEDDQEFDSYEVDEFIHETDKAWLLDVEGLEDWFPKSVCEYEGEGSVLIPRWLAKKKGLI